MSAGPVLPSLDLPPRPPLRVVLRDFAPYRRLAAGAGVAVVLMVVGSVAMPAVVDAVVNHAVVGHEKSWVLIGFALGLVCVSLTITGAYIEARCMGRLSERYLCDLRGKLLDHLNALDLDYFTREPAGRVVSRLTSDVENLQIFLRQGLSLMVRGSLMFVVTVAVMFAMCWQLTLAVLAVMPFLVAASIWYRPRAFNVQMSIRESMANLLTYVNESLVGMRVVQAYAIEDAQQDRFVGVNDRTYEAKRHSGAVVATYYAVVELLNPIALAVIIGYGAYLVDHGVIEIGTVIAFTLYLTRLFEPIQQFSELTHLLQAASASFSRLFEFRAVEPNVHDLPGAVPFVPGRGLVEVDHVTFRYGPSSPAVLHDVDLRVAPGERIAVVGTSGAGKSTLAKLVARFYDPTEGVVRIDGQDVRHVTAATLRRDVVVVPQEGFLFDGTIRDNIMLARPDAPPGDADAAWDALGLGEAGAIPGGLDLVVGNRGLTLSSGQRQLVALARALFAAPRVVVLDEATSNVDPATDAALEHALGLLLDGRSAIVIAHRVPTALRADRVVVFAHGRIVEAGAPAELEANDGPFAAWIRATREAATLAS
jgi:ATP-binding cassette, subfamily B, bacterial